MAKILRIYDNEAMANLAASILRDNGIESHIVGNYASAIEGQAITFGGVQILIHDSTDSELCVKLLDDAGL